MKDEKQKMDRLSNEVLIMTFKRVDLRESGRIALVCKLWLGCVRQAHARELEFVEMFNSSRIKEMCLMPVDELGNKFYRYAISLCPELKDNINENEMINDIEKIKLIKFLSKTYVFIKKNIDRLILSYRILFMKYDILFRLVNHEEFRRELGDRHIFIIWKIVELNKIVD
jgi:F-box domain